MVNFAQVKAMTIPEGAVAQLLIEGNVIWSSSHLHYKLSEDGTHYICCGVRSTFDGTAVMVPASIAGLPVSAVGAGAFSALTELTKVTFGTTPMEIAADAFAGCNKLATVVMPAASDVLDGSPWGSGVDRPIFYIEGVQYRKHSSNSSRYVVDVPSSTLFKGGDIELVSKIGGVNVYELDSSCFKNKTTLTGITIPATIKAIEASVFSGCTGLTKATFKGKPASNTMPATVFTGCTNLLDVYVPWAEGVVANAPWGAENATIHYNWQS